MALSASLTAGETLSPGLSAHAIDSPRAAAFALASAIVIAAYTVVDAPGPRASGNAWQYVVALYLLNGWPFGLLVLRRRGVARAWLHARWRWWPRSPRCARPRYCSPR